MFDAIRRAFRPLDTTAADEAIAAAERGHRDVQVRARALRMDVGCGDPVEAIRRLTAPVDHRGGFFSRLFCPADDTPADMKGLLGKL